MNLSPANLLTLKQAIAAETDPDFVALRDAGATGAMANFYNVDASPAFWVWRTLVTRSEIYHSTSVDGTTWDWTTFKNQGVSEQGAWREMFMGENANFSLDNLRGGVGKIFGVANAQTMHILTIARRLAKRGERLFTTGTGSTAAPGKLGVEGNVTNENIVSALAS